MPECEVCGAADGLIYTCNECGAKHCDEHRLPEKHSCPGLAPADRTRLFSTTSSTSAGGGGMAPIDWVLGLIVLPFLIALKAVMFPFRSGTTLLASIVLVGVVASAGVGAGVIDAQDTGAPAVADAAEGFADWVVGGAGDSVDSTIGQVGSGGAEDGFDEERVEYLIHREVNERREAAGLPELHYHEGLSDDAWNHSHDMARRAYFSHTNPEGEGPQERTTTNCLVGENLAQMVWEQPTRIDGERVEIDSPEQLAEETVNGWMNSPGHRRNILDERYAAEGIGVFRDGDKVYVTQMFCV